MTDQALGRFVRAYLERVVNDRNLSAVDELIAQDYRGSGEGWPQTVGELRAFYAEQARARPDWHIDVQETVELGEVVVVRARAGGTVLDGGTPRVKRLEWLASYRVRDGLIREINLLSLVDRGLA